MRLMTLLVTAALLVACGDEEEQPRSCTAAGCGGASLPVAFVADAETLSSLKGEFRQSEMPERLLRFHCGQAEDDLELPCADGRVDLGVTPVWPGVTVEVRFAIAGGGRSDWQKVVLNLSERTLEDFNGPGCPCTYYQANPDPVTVPGAASLDSGL
jgi:hypothetical protein